MAGTQMGERPVWELWETASRIQFENWAIDASLSRLLGSGQCESAASQTPTETDRRMKIPTPQFLEQRKSIILSDLKMKIEAEDWHGVADAAMDLREIEAQVKMVEVKPATRPSSCEHEWRYSIVTDLMFCQLCHATQTAENAVQS